MLGLPVTTVRSRIHAARNRGLLDRGRQGYAGGQLLPAAKPVLKTKKGLRHGRATGSRRRHHHAAGDGRWMAQVDLGGTTAPQKPSMGRRVVRSPASYSVLLRRCNRATSSRMNGRRSNTSSVDGWSTRRVASARARGRRYEQAVRLHLIPGLGKLPVARLKVDQVEAWFDRHQAAGATRADDPLCAGRLARGSQQSAESRRGHAERGGARRSADACPAEDSAAHPGGGPYIPRGGEAASPGRDRVGRDGARTCGSGRRSGCSGSTST